MPPSTVITPLLIASSKGRAGRADGGLETDDIARTVGADVGGRKKAGSAWTGPNARVKTRPHACRPRRRSALPRPTPWRSHVIPDHVHRARWLTGIRGD